MKDEPVIVAMGDCVACGQLFAFNPARVPSLRAIFDRVTRQWKRCDTRQPMCETCVRRFNARRRAAGLDEIPILAGAYDAGPVSDLDG